MSRLDYFTMAVVAVCILAIAFLLYRTTNLIGGGPEKPKSDLQETLKEMGIEDEDMANPEDLESEPGQDASSASDNSGNTSGESDDLDYTTPSESTPPTTKPSSPTPAKPSTSSTATTKPSSGTSYSSSGDYMVVAGSFKVRQNAETLANQLQKAGFSNASVEIFDKGTFAVVVVDRFTNAADASSLVGKLKDAKFDSYVQKKRPSN